MSDTDKRAIQLKPENLSGLLTEVSRAYMNGGLPHSLLRRVAEGVLKAADQTANPQDKELYMQFAVWLNTQVKEWDVKEQQHYSM